MWPSVSLQHHQLLFVSLVPPDLLDLDDTDEEDDAELKSLSNPQSGEGKGGRSWSTHNPHHPWPQFLCNAQPHSLYDSPGLCLGPSHWSAEVGSLASCIDWS